MTQSFKTAVVIWSHGSRDPEWKENIESIAQRMRQASPQTKVACAYLELCPPDLVQAVAPLVVAGVRQIRLVPLFFGMGTHIRKDLPERVNLLRQAYPDLGVELLKPAGDHPGVQDAVVRYALESLA